MNADPWAIVEEALVRDEDSDARAPVIPPALAVALRAICRERDRVAKAAPMPADLATLLDGLRRLHRADLCPKAWRADAQSLVWASRECSCGTDEHNAILDALRLAIVADRDRAVAEMRERCAQWLEADAAASVRTARESPMCDKDSERRRASLACRFAAAIRALPVTKDGA